MRMRLRLVAEHVVALERVVVEGGLLGRGRRQLRRGRLDRALHAEGRVGEHVAGGQRLHARHQSPAQHCQPRATFCSRATHHHAQAHRSSPAPRPAQRAAAAPARRRRPPAAAGARATCAGAPPPPARGCPCCCCACRRRAGPPLQRPRPSSWSPARQHSP